MRKLTPKQARFVDEYLIDLNATQAAIRAGYSARTAEQVGHQLLKKTSVQAAIAERMKSREQRTEITQDKVLAELARIAFGNKRALMKWGPDGVKLVDSATITDDDAAMVSEVSESVTEAGGTIKLKTHDKVKALELLGKHLGLFGDKLELTGKGGGPVQQVNMTPADLEAATESAMNKLLRRGTDG